VTDPAEMIYCPRCATPLVDLAHSGKLRRSCPNCRFIYFQDPKVAVIVRVILDGKVLMVKRNMDPEKGKWALPAGFIDYGEDPREAAKREVKEETGLDVTITRLIDVLGPDGAPGSKTSIAILFEAEVNGGTLLGADDVDEAVFFLQGDVPHAELAVFESLRVMIGEWLETGK
jgi:8-oxo-dGTP diphosphatase